jgi:hypothetical protein
MTIATGTGRVAIVMEGGELSRVVIELAGLDVGQLILELLTDEPGDDERIEVRCLAGELALTRGRGEITTLLLDTPKDKLTGEGSIDLRDERLDVLLRVFPRDASFASARMPIRVEGRIKEPSIAPAPGGVESRVLGWVLAPLAALVPFVELGSEDDRPCAGVVERVRGAVPR